MPFLMEMETEFQAISQPIRMTNLLDRSSSRGTDLQLYVAGGQIVSRVECSY